MLKTNYNIEKTEWAGTTKDESHFLYQQTPKIVESKIKLFLNAKANPVIDSRTKEVFERIAFESDILIYPDKANLKKAEEVYNILTDAIAILAFVEGGVEVFGYRYEAWLEER